MTTETNPPASSSSSVGLLIRGLIIVLLVLALLVAYGWRHKPFDIEFGVGTALRIGGAALDLLTAAALAVAAGGIGRALLSRLNWSSLDSAAGEVSRAERVGMEGIIGLAALSTVLLIVGMLGLFQPSILWIGVIAAALVCNRGVRGWFADIGGVMAGGFRADSDHGVRWMRFSVVFVCVLLALALFEAVAPPARWDSLAYQLVAPARYLETGRIDAQPDNFYLGFPQQINLLFGLTMGAFGRDTAAAPVHYLYGLFGLLATMGYARRMGGKVAGWTAALLLLSSYNLWALFGWSYTDLAVMTYGALTLIAASRWRSTNGRGWLILMGVLVGLALGVKYTAGALAASVAVFVLVYSPPLSTWMRGWLLGNLGVRLQNGIVAGLAALIAFLPWMIRGIALFGNPIYPFVFGGLAWDATRAEFFSFTERGLLATGNAIQAFIVPISATVFGMDKADGYGFTAGAWLMTTFILLPFVWRWLNPRERRGALESLVVLAPLLVIWAITALGSSVGMQTRLMAMTLPAFAVAGALALNGLAALPKKPLDVNFIVRTLMIVTIFLYALDGVRIWMRDLIPQVVMGVNSVDDYLYTQTGAFLPAMRHLETLPADAQVRFMWEPRGYYCPDTLTCRADVLFDHWLHPLLTGSTPDEVFEQYRASGDDYLLVWHAGFTEYDYAFARYTDLTTEFYPTLERYMDEVWTDGLRYSLYTWRE